MMLIDRCARAKLKFVSNFLATKNMCMNSKIKIERPILCLYLVELLARNNNYYYCYFNNYYFSFIFVITSVQD